MIKDVIIHEIGYLGEGASVTRVVILKPSAGGKGKHGPAQLRREAGGFTGMFGIADRYRGLSSSGTESRIERVIFVQERCGRMRGAWPRPR